MFKCWPKPVCSLQNVWVWVKSIHVPIRNWDTSIHKIGIILGVLQTTTCLWLWVCSTLETWLKPEYVCSPKHSSPWNRSLCLLWRTVWVRQHSSPEPLSPSSTWAPLGQKPSSLLTCYYVAARGENSGNQPRNQPILLQCWALITMPLSNRFGFFFSPLHCHTITTLLRTLARHLFVSFEMEKHT